MDNELNRLLALRQYNILDTPTEKDFDDIVFVASQICGVPISLISLIDSDRQWFKSKIGIDAAETSRKIAFCDHAIRGNQTFIVEDTHKDDRFKDNPLVKSDPKIRFYAGALLTTADGYNIGTLCVIDQKPIQLTSVQLQSLEALARQVVSLFELRRKLQIENDLNHKIIENKITLDSFFNTCPLMMGIVEVKDGKIIHVADNSATAEFLKFPKKIKYPVPADQLGTPEDHIKTWLDHYKKAEQTKAPVYFNYVHKGRNLKAIVNLISHLKNQPPKFSFVVMDETDQIKAQEESEIQKAKIIHGSRLTALGEMAGSIAHEINNPLAVIKASSQLLDIELKREKMALSPKVFESIKRIDTTVDRISKIVKGLRSFARDGESDPMQPVNLGLVVTEALDLSQTRFKSHGIDINYQPAVDNYIVHGRAVELAQVIINILNNAHDAALESTEKFVQIKLESDSTSAFLIVEDSGPGIPSSIIGKVMDPFFTTKPIGQGTGLGLSISKGIIECHGGEIIYNRLNNKTQFKIRLPLLEVSQKAI
jgi:signal transduction histidine kinase